MGRWFSNINLYRGTSFGVCISNCFLGIATRTVLICQTQRLKAKVTLLLWLLRKKLRVPHWKSWTTFHVYWVSHPCPHTLSPSPGLLSCPPSLYHYHSCPSSHPTGLFRARIVSCLHSSASRLAPGSLLVKPLLASTDRQGELKLAGLDSKLPML